MEKNDDARNHNQDKRVKYYNEPSDYVVTIRYGKPDQSGHNSYSQTNQREKPLQTSQIQPLSLRFP